MELPTGPRNPRNPNGPLASLVRAEALMQIAILLPGTVVAGWLLGLWLDHLLHTGWINIAGLIFGCVAAFMQVFHLIGKANKP